MPVLNFPSSPALDQVYEESSRSWKWNGTSWIPTTVVGLQGPEGLQGPTGSPGTPGPTIYPATGIAVSTGTAWNTSLSIPLTIANGGTGQITRQAALDALAGSTTSGSYLRGNGTNVLMSAIQAADVPTLNQNTTGTAANVTGTVAIANGGTGATTAPAALAALVGFTTTATAAATTTLTNASSSYQIFTGTTTQTIVLPVTSTLATGWTFHIVNNSTGVLTVNSSGGNLVISVPAGVTTMCTCIGITLTTAANWKAGFTDFSTVTGTGSIVLAASPTLSGTPLAVTATEKTSTTQIATTAFVDRLRSLTAPTTLATGGTAVIGDRGALLSQTSGSVTVPASIFAARDVLTIFNNSASAQTITQGAGLTMYFAGTATTGNRTLAQRGLATIVFISATVAVISGGGLT